MSAALYLSLSYAINLNSANLRVSPVKKKFVASASTPNLLVEMTLTEHLPRTVFITIDSLTTIVQIVGAALIGVAESKDSRGESTSVSSDQANNILLVGLALQVSAQRPTTSRIEVSRVDASLFTVRLLPRIPCHSVDHPHSTSK